MKIPAAMVGFLLCAFASDSFALPKPKDWSLNDWEKFIEEGVQIGLGEALGRAGSAVPLVDVYSALSAFGNSKNTLLMAWLRNKQVEARTKGDDARADRYQDVETCITTGDCQRLAALQVAPAPSPTGSSDLSGHWKSTIGFEYDITPSENGYQWVVTKGTPNETGKIAIAGEGGRMKADWSGTHGSGSASGRVVTEGGSLTIEWENGVYFFR